MPQELPASSSCTIYRPEACWTHSFAPQSHTMGQVCTTAWPSTAGQPGNGSGEQQNSL